MSNTILLNIERTRTRSSIGDRTRTPYFWLQMIEHNRAFTRFTKLLIKLTQTSFFLNIERTQMCSSSGNQTRTPYFYLPTIEHQTSNIVWPITTFYWMNLNNIFWILNKLKHHFSKCSPIGDPIFGFKRSGLTHH